MTACFLFSKLFEIKTLILLSSMKNNNAVRNELVVNQHSLAQTFGSGNGLRLTELQLSICFSRIIANITCKTSEFVFCLLCWFGENDGFRLFGINYSKSQQFSRSLGWENFLVMNSTASHFPQTGQPLMCNSTARCTAVLKLLTLRRSRPLMELIL